MTYRLTAPVTAIKECDGNAHAVLLTVPAGSTVHVMGEAEVSGLVNVSFDGDTISIFLRDLVDRGEVVRFEVPTTEDGRSSDPIAG